MDEMITQKMPVIKTDEDRRVMVKFPGRWAGQVVNNRTGDVLKVLVQFREYKGRGPVVLSAVDPDMVE